MIKMVVSFHTVKKESKSQFQFSTKQWFSIKARCVSCLVKWLLLGKLLRGLKFRSVPQPAIHEIHKIPDTINVAPVILAG